MIETDEIAVWLAAGVLRSSDHEIEAASLEASVADAGEGGVDAALEEAARSERRGGAFGLEIAGSLLIPILVEAARQFWSAYQKELMDRLGKTAAEASFNQLRKWFGEASQRDRQVVSSGLVEKIREVGSARGLKPEDIEALVAAAAPERLAPQLLGS